MNRKNLLKLAKYLWKHAEKLQPSFEMEVFASLHEEDCEAHCLDIAVDLRKYCGSVGCAVGWGPAAGIKPHVNEYWGNYWKRCFDVTPAQYDWCFTYYWAEYDNTVRGAAKRILLLLLNRVPKGFFLPNGEWAAKYNKWEPTKAEWELAANDQ